MGEMDAVGISREGGRRNRTESDRYIQIKREKERAKMQYDMMLQDVTCHVHIQVI